VVSALRIPFLIGAGSGGCRIASKLAIPGVERVCVNSSWRDLDALPREVVKVKGVHEAALKGILARASEMKGAGQIGDFEWIIESATGYRGDIYYTGRLRPLSICRGRPITVTAINLRLA